MRNNEKMETILDLSHVKARRHFLESQNYCNIPLPKYIDFTPVLKFVDDKVQKKALYNILKYKGKGKSKDENRNKVIDKDKDKNKDKNKNKDKEKDETKMPSLFENVNYKMLFKKDVQYSYRPYQLINPYLYYLLVKDMTNKKSWDEIKNRFAELAVPNIEVASIPKIKRDKDKSHASASVTSWWEKVEQRSLELALSYRYMFVTDITNCYGSLYTHTIAWAMMGKEKAKAEPKNQELLGNVIDKYMQQMQYAQTNGIPQGSVLSDFIAEIVLAYADNLLSKKLKAENITSYRIIRYRDDYRVFSDSKEEIERIAFFSSRGTIRTELSTELPKDQAN